MRIAAALLLAAAAVGCSSGSDTATPATTRVTASTSTLTTSTSAPGDGSCYTGTSPTSYDPDGGVYATFLTKVDAASRDLSFDVIQWLSGDDAADAYQRDHPGEREGPPNDYYIVNANERTYTAPVSPAATVRLVRLQQDGNADLDKGTFAELPDYLAREPAGEGSHLSSSPFWLTVQRGEVVDICEQYRP